MMNHVIWYKSAIDQSNFVFHVLCLWFVRGVEDMEFPGVLKKWKVDFLGVN